MTMCSNSKRSLHLHMLLSIIIISTTLPQLLQAGAYTAGPWQSAHATFHGGSDASGSMGGACVKASEEGWLPLARNWGQNWQCCSILAGGALSFRVTTSDGRTLTSWNVAGPSWRFGQTFTADNNFDPIT